MNQLLLLVKNLTNNIPRGRKKANRRVKQNPMKHITTLQPPLAISSVNKPMLLSSSQLPSSPSQQSLKPLENKTNSSIKIIKRKEIQNNNKEAKKQKKVNLKLPDVDELRSWI